MGRSTARIVIALAVLAGGAAVSLLFGRLSDVVPIMFVAGVAAVLVTAHPSADRPRIAEPPAGAAGDWDGVLDTLAEPVLLVRDGRIATANRAAVALLGPHIVGEDARLAIRHPAAAARLAPDASDPGTVDLVGIGPLDQRWEMRVTPIGERERVVQLLDQTGSYAAERMRVDFVANASHELRTPLASILGFVETLSDETAGADPQTRARFLTVMLNEAQRMQRLVEDLLSLSRIEAGKYRLPNETVDLAALARTVADELRQAQPARGADLVIHFTDGAMPVQGDRAQLSQLLHNVIGNAMKYGRTGTPVVLALQHEPGTMLKLSVADTGEGIAPEHIPRLTERFYRADPGRSRALGGTGLGLAIVKHIVERHRGRLDIASVLGSGTTVLVHLPSAACEDRVIKA